MVFVLGRFLGPKGAYDSFRLAPSLRKFLTCINRLVGDAARIYRRASPTQVSVMAGLVPAIHVLRCVTVVKDVDARHKAGHDGVLRVGLIML